MWAQFKCDMKLWNSLIYFILLHWNCVNIKFETFVTGKYKRMEKQIHIEYMDMNEMQHCKNFGSNERGLPRLM